MYRARDAKLDRDVALKVLPDAFASDPERLARFEREAKVLASLNHPNIGAIYGLEKSGNTRELVLELIEGPTLADRIKQGPIPLDEALPIAKQIAEALEAAHEKGIIHRDLKPANIKVRDDGTVKVLDFGLAKALNPLPEGDASQSPTLTAAATQMGVILGTAAYMSPEQARGKTADKRADVWAFGAVLFEMLSGRKAFFGDDLTDTIAAVVRGEPAWDKLPNDVPARLTQVMRACLQKDRAQRVRDVGDVALAMDGRFETTVNVPSAEPSLPQPERWRQAVPWAAGIALGGLIAGFVAWTLFRPPPPLVSRFTVVAPEAPGELADVLSPDGRVIAFASNIAGGGEHVYLRRLDALETTPLRGAEGTTPFGFSPDGEWLLVSDVSELKKVPLAGGPAITIADDTFRVADWGPGDIIVSGSEEGLWTVPASGGERQPLVAPAEGENGSYYAPRFLPNGQAVLFYIWNGSPDESQVAVYDVDAGEQRVLLSGTSPQFATSGHLVFFREGSLWAAPFDPDRLEVRGEPRPVVEQVGVNILGWARYSVAHDGTLAYRHSGDGGRMQQTLVWVDRQGNEEALGADPRPYDAVQLSPDGRRVVAEVDDPDNTDVWIYDVDRDTPIRFTLHPASDNNPIWTPDGERVVFSSNRDGFLSLCWKAADGTEDAELLRASTGAQWATSFSPDGRSLVFVEGQRSNRSLDIGVLSIDGERTVEWLLESDFNEDNGVVSPDGRWLAYQSDETGQPEVHVRPFPNVDGGRWQVSTS